jgi:hypothetical protein
MKSQPRKPFYNLSQIKAIKKIDNNYLGEFKCTNHNEQNYEKTFKELFQEDKFVEDENKDVKTIYGTIFFPNDLHQRNPRECEKRETEKIILECLKKNSKCFNFIYVNKFYSEYYDLRFIKFIVRCSRFFSKEFKIGQLSKALKLGLFSEYEGKYCMCMKINFLFPVDYKYVLKKLLNEENRNKPFFIQSEVKERQLMCLMDLEKFKKEKEEEKIIPEKKILTENEKFLNKIAKEAEKTKSKRT